ncbi:MAG: fasciclin domain-containing protein [Bacteroidales bacterium]
MKTSKSILKFTLLFLFTCTACEKKFDEYYSVPDDLIGTILEVLNEDGNYTQFIKAVKLVEFDDVLGKTGNFTVFAPDDEAFSQFFLESGYPSLEDIPEEELKGIVFYHIVFWAYSKFMLQFGLNIQDDDIDYSAANFKQPTRYTPPTSIEFDTMGRKYNVYHETKYIPIYSTALFMEFDLDASYNYSFLYPETTFKGFNVDRAEVTEFDVPAQNGWIHRIDRVLVPPLNHDKILKQKSEFSTFRNLIDKHTFYQFNSGYTTAQDNEGDVNEDGIIDSLFLKMNSLFPDGSSPDVENVAYSGYQNILTMFAPSNQALQDFLSDRTEGYSSLDQIGEFWISWYLSHYMSANYWPSQYTTLTEEWDWDLTSSLVDCNVYEEDILYSQMASNGPFCGINKYFLPKIFESVAEPVMGSKDYEWFSDMLTFYMVDRLLNEDNLIFTLFAPSNDAMRAAGYMFRTGLGGYGLYHDSNPLTPVEPSTAKSIVSTHVVFGELEEGDFEEGTFIESAQQTYIGVTENGIYGGGDLAKAHVGGAEPVAGKGVLYRIDRMLVSPDNSIFDIISNTGTYPQYKQFYQLCFKAGLIVLDEDSRPESLDNISIGNFYSCFVPTNEALEAGVANGVVPADPDSLKQFLRYHFIEGVVFDDGKLSGEFNTTRIDEESGYLFSTIEILNEKYKLSIQDELGNIRNVVAADHMAEDGVIHQIDSYLLFNE